jgi:threonine/homoserine/homoserine lactone efflux protein
MSNPTDPNFIILMFFCLAFLLGHINQAEFLNYWVQIFAGACVAWLFWRNNS